MAKPRHAAFAAKIDSTQAGGTRAGALPLAIAWRPPVTLLAGMGLVISIGLSIATVAAHIANRNLGLAEAWPDQTRFFWLINASSALIFAIPGWYLATKRPKVVYGWLALVAGVGHGLGGIGMEWAVASQLGAHQLPLPTLGLWMAAWGPLVEQPVLMVAYGLFPDGRLPRGWTRWPVVGSIVLAIAGTATVVLGRYPGTGAIDPALAWLANPFSIGGARAPQDVAVFFAPAAVAIIVVLVVRWRKAQGDERRVLSWIVTVGVPVTITVPISVVALPDGVGTAVAQFSTLIEVAVIVSATLRYRVYGIEVVLNRTLVFTALTAVVAAVYGAAIGLAALLGASGTGAISFVGALAAALALAPARTRIQRAVNHLLYGARDEPYVVLSRIAADLETAGSAEQLLPVLVSTAASTLRVPYVAIELDGAAGAHIASSTSDGGPVTRIPLVHQGRALGTLVVGRRPGEPAIPGRERRLLEDLARQAAVAASNVVLTEDLRRSRERIVSAREEERRRLRMDLHDGLGPQLTGVALGLDLVAEAVEEDAPLVAADTERLRHELHDAIQDVRRLVQGLRPPRLDEVGLPGALREMAGRAERSGLRVGLDVPAGCPALPAAVEVAAYRIATEAINNVVRHAAATTCTITLRIGPDLHLSVVDDGRGLDDPFAGTGTASMRQRAEELGGSCTLAAATPKGCRVEALIPIGST